MATGISSCGAMLLYCPHNTCAALDLTIVYPSALSSERGCNPPIPRLLYIRSTACSLNISITMNVRWKCW